MRLYIPLVGVVLAIAATGCANFTDAAPIGDDGAEPACSVSLMASPREPTAGEGVEVSATALHAPEPADYVWRVLFNGAPVPFTMRTDRPAIVFATQTPGIYEVQAEIKQASCSSPVQRVNVRARGAIIETVRLRVVPPRSAAAPPHEQRIGVRGGAPADLDVIVLDAGVEQAVTVTGPGGGVPAYLQFSPLAMPDAIVEAFSNSSGAGSVQLVRQPHSVLVVPLVPGSAPHRLTMDPGLVPTQQLALGVGSAISGTVRDPADAPLAGATVRIATNGVPSTVATTDDDGNFSLRAVTGGGNLTVEVVPPAASGLPRLSATSAVFDLSFPLQVRYDPGVALTDLAGAVVKREDAPVPGARVTVVGSLGAAGTVTVGNAATPTVATGEVRVAATTDASGALPTMRVPSAALAAVVEVTPGDLAVVAFDATAGAPATLDALPRASITAVLVDAHNAALPGATLELVPIGALALAGAPTLRFAAGSGGRVGDASSPVKLPPGGHYELRFHDPMGRAAPLIIADREALTVSGTHSLPAAVRLQGVVRLAGQPLANASVQILCDSCGGIARVKPLVEVKSDAAGQFVLAVRDPGTR